MSRMNDPYQDDALKPRRCCICDAVKAPCRTVALLDVKGTPGQGWGCVVCNLSMDGAVAVVCDACADGDSPIRFACDGYIDAPGRIPMEQLTRPHRHNRAFHPELEEE